MSAAAERLAPREGLEARLADALDIAQGADPESPVGVVLDVAAAEVVVGLVLDAIDAEGFSVVPDEWVPDAAVLDDAADRLDSVRALLADRRQVDADTARRTVREMTDLACTVLGLPPRGERS